MDPTCDFCGSSYNVPEGVFYASEHTMDMLPYADVAVVEIDYRADGSRTVKLPVNIFHRCSRGVPDPIDFAEPITP